MTKLKVIADEMAPITMKQWLYLLNRVEDKKIHFENGSAIAFGGGIKDSDHYVEMKNPYSFYLE